MKVALLQLDLVWEDIQANHGRAAKKLKEAADHGARLAILPEMFATGFSMDVTKMAQPPAGPTETWLRGLSTGLGMWILAGVAEAGTPHPRNNALLASPEGDIQRYTKIHPFSSAGEHKVMASGNRLVTWLVEGVRVTPFICYDLRFPEPFRMLADETDLYVVIANWPDRRRAHWQTLVRARAIENLAYVAAVNRVGDGGTLHYTGDSALVSPWGETLVSAAEDEALLIADVDPARVAAWRATFPALDDRKPNSYVV